MQKYIGFALDDILEKMEEIGTNIPKLNALSEESRIAKISDILADIIFAYPMGHLIIERDLLDKKKLNVLILSILEALKDQGLNVSVAKTHSMVWEYLKRKRNTEFIILMAAFSFGFLFSCLLIDELSRIFT